MLPSAADLIARYLRLNGYTETLNSFIKEAGLSVDVGANSSDGITIEQVLQEKKTFDLSLRFEKLGVEEGNSWHSPSPTSPTILSTLPTKTNVLSVQMLDLLLPGSAQSKTCITATTADRRLNLLDPSAPSLLLLHSLGHIQDSPVLDLIVIQRTYLLAASMSGRLVLYNTATDQIVDERRDHSKYLLKISSWSAAGATWIASAGWDSKVHLYKLKIIDGNNAQLGEPLTTLTLPTIPETVLFIEGPESSAPILLLSRRDSTFLFYYACPSAGDDSGLTLLGKQNLAPHSNAWIAFSPSDVQICPTDPSIAAVATSSTPHMKLLIVRLLVPPSQSFTTRSGAHMQQQTPGTGEDLGSQGTAAPVTQASQARAELVIQDREEAAITINVNTMAPQSLYSTPRLAWRPDGSGVYVTSDDGIVRGFETSTGKLMVSLDGHEPGSKIRCLYAGYLPQRTAAESSDTHSKEYLLSGGFDQRLIFWNAL